MADVTQPVSALRAGVEAILFVADAPVPAARIAEALGIDPADAETIITEIADEAADRGLGWELRSSAEGWRLFTAARCASVVEAFIGASNQTRLSRAALETLAVVAYRQPVTRSQVAAVRGVNVDGVMRTLALRGLIVEAGQEPTTGAVLYVTTEMFMELLGLDSLEQLPDLAPLLPDVDTIDVE